jgi:hypothetical protein
LSLESFDKPVKIKSCFTPFARRPQSPEDSKREIS